MSGAPKVRLLGNGLDAIVQRATPPRSFWDRLRGKRAAPCNALLVKPDEQAQRLRYYTAVSMHPADGDLESALLRASIGANFNQAWRAGLFPDFKTIRDRVQGRLRGPDWC